MRHRRIPYRLALCALVASVVSVTAASAQKTGQMPRQLEGTGVDQKLGDVIPQDLILQNEDGDDVSLGSLFDGERPVVLALVYHTCPMLCSMVLHGLTETLGRMDWMPGEEFDVLTISFNHRETPAISSEKKAMYLDMLGKREAAAGWHFLTGDKASIAALTEAVGFRFRWVEDEQQYAHPSTLIFLGGDRTISRYITGIEFDPRDVRKALVEASEGQVGSAIDQVLLYCFQYDPTANSYVPHAVNLMRIGGGLTILMLGFMLFVYWRGEARRSRLDAAG